jgi:hypothetical protein
MASGTKQVQQSDGFSRGTLVPSLPADNRELPIAAQVTTPSIQDLADQWAAVVRQRYKPC